MRETTDTLKVQDLMRREQLIEPMRLIALFDAIEPALVRYPAIDAAYFREKVRNAVNAMEEL